MKKIMILVLISSCLNSLASFAESADCSEEAAQALSQSSSFHLSYCNYDEPLNAGDLTPVKGSATSFRWKGECQGGIKSYVVTVKDKACSSFYVSR